MKTSSILIFAALVAFITYEISYAIGYHDAAVRMAKKIDVCVVTPRCPAI